MSMKRTFLMGASGPSTPPGTNWSIIGNGMGAADLRDVAYGNGLYVAVGVDCIATSTDGITWTRNLSSSFNSNTTVFYGNGLWVVGSTSSSIHTSTDGLTWSTQSVTMSTQSITYGAGLWVMVGASGAIQTSPDAITWTAATSGTAVTLADVVYNGTRFVAVGAGGVICYSSTGTGTWTAITSGAVAFAGVTWTGTMFIAVSTSNSTSSDGVTWTLGGAVHGFGAMQEPASDGTTHVMVGPSTSLNGGICSSTNGTTWTIRSSSLGLPTVSSWWQAVTYGGGKFVAVGSQGITATSTDGITWSMTYPQWAGRGITAIFYSATKNLWLMGLQPGQIYSSSDLITWTLRSSLATSAVNAFAENSTTIVAVCSGRIQSSTDGITWTSRGTTTLNNVIWDSVNSLFVAAGGSGVIQTSPTGTTWTARTSGTGSITLDAIAYAGQLIVGTQSGTFTKSPTGVTWTYSATAIVPTTVATLNVFAGKLIVTDTNGNTRYSTDNSATWSTQVSGTKFSSCAVGGNTAVYVGSIGLSGNAPYVYTTLDGVTFTPRTIPIGGTNAGLFFENVAYGAGKFVVVGTSGNIMVSSN